MEKNYILKNTYRFFFSTFLMIFVFIISPYKLYSQQECNAELIAINNKTSKKAGKSGTAYYFKLTNLSTNRTTYTILVENSNADNSVELNAKIFPVKNEISVKSNTLKKIDNQHSVTLKSGEQYSFYIKMNVPSGTKFGVKNTSKVTVNSSNCVNFSVSKNLYTTIIDGE